MGDNRHAHDHDADGGHAPHQGTQEDMALPNYGKRILAIRELLVDKGLVDKDDVRGKVDAMDARSPADGARVVARAWTDPGFKRRLLDSPKAAVGELGYSRPQDPELAVLENTEQKHHLVVCTLCSCYPISLLGRPPDWYKSLAYRSRAVTDPRGVIREFGLELDDDVEVHVVDSTADLRYLILPRRPAGTENLSQEELAELVTRDSMIGVAHPHSTETAAPQPLL